MNATIEGNCLSANANCSRTEWLNGFPKDAQVEVALLDDGESPLEQIEEFQILSEHIRVSNILMAHDALTRK